jgi:hypothetical protein
LRRISISNTQTSADPPVLSAASNSSRTPIRPHSNNLALAAIQNANLSCRPSSVHTHNFFPPLNLHLGSQTRRLDQKPLTGASGQGRSGADFTSAARRVSRSTRSVEGAEISELRAISGNRKKQLMPYYRVKHRLTFFLVGYVRRPEPDTHLHCMMGTVAT